MSNDNKRDYREETLLNAAEFALLREIAGDLGLSKAAALRYCMHVVGDDHMRRKRLAETGRLTDV